MAQERAYRELLDKAQASVEPIRAFLDGARKAPLATSDVRLSMLIEAAESHARTIERELDEIWDLLKRAL